MSPELIETLYKKYPLTFQRGDHIFDFSCNDGWYQIIDDLSGNIEKTLLLMENPQDNYVVQIKEKFGQLCFYMSFSSSVSMSEAKYLKEISDFIVEAQNNSRFICENTGKPGKRRVIMGWYKTLCDEEFEKAKTEKAPF